MNKEELWWAWLAGFIDGEGSIRIARSVAPSGYQYQPRIEVTNTSGVVITHLQAATGLGTTHISRASTLLHPWQQAHRWIVVSEQAITVARRIMPYLRVRDIQAKVLLQFPMTAGRVRLSPQIRSRRAELYAYMEELNERGTDERNPDDSSFNN